MESREDTSSRTESVIDIIKNCTFGKLNDVIDSLPTYDIEYMFLQIRQKSVS